MTGQLKDRSAVTVRGLLGEPDRSTGSGSALRGSKDRTKPDLQTLIREGDKWLLVLFAREGVGEVELDSALQVSEEMLDSLPMLGTRIGVEASKSGHGVGNVWTLSRTVARYGLFNISCVSYFSLHSLFLTPLSKSVPFGLIGLHLRPTRIMLFTPNHHSKYSFVFILRYATHHWIQLHFLLIFHHFWKFNSNHDLIVRRTFVGIISITLHRRSS